MNIFICVNVIYIAIKDTNDGKLTQYQSDRSISHHFSSNKLNNPYENKGFDSDLALRQH